MKEIALIIVMMTAPDKPDITHMEPVTSLEECYAGAKKWLAKSLTDDMKAHGIIGLAATCAWREKKDGDPA
jgi:hypothetical protein